MQNGLPQVLNFQGQSKCLAHLSPFVHNLVGHGPGGRDLCVRVSFESHVFSDSFGSGPHDFLDENGNKRYFCSSRYSYSHGLPAEVRAILAQNEHTWEEKDKNQVANLAVLTPAGSALVSGHYNVIIYYLYPSALPGVDVEMIIKTCYRKFIDFKRRPKREKIRVFVKRAFYKQLRIPKG